MSQHCIDENTITHQRYFGRYFGKELQNLPKHSPTQMNKHSSKPSLPSSQTTIAHCNFFKGTPQLSNRPQSTLPSTSSAMEVESPQSMWSQSESFACVASDPQFVEPYIEEIFQHIDENEMNAWPNPAYMERIQTDINARMRTILIDWIVEVHLKFKMVPETLFLTVNLIDRFLSHNRVAKNQLQLVGVAALFVASKYEEIYAPELKDFVYICDRAYTKQEILRAEGLILQTVQFTLSISGPVVFLQKQFILGGDKNFDCELFHLSCYLLELCLHDYACIQYQIPSNQKAAAASSYAGQLLCMEGFPSPYDQQALAPCMGAMKVLLRATKFGQFPAVKRKYGDTMHMCVSDLNMN